jgi:mannose-6-phosphate isomerase class I
VSLTTSRKGQKRKEFEKGLTIKMEKQETDSSKFEYDRFPKMYKEASPDEYFCGAEKMAQEIRKRAANREKTVVVLDLYPGVSDQTVQLICQALGNPPVFDSEDCMIDRTEYQKRIFPYLTNDRVFGKMCWDKRWIDFFDREKLEKMRQTVSSLSGLLIVYGVGAACVTKGDLLIGCDLSRWEIQCRYKRGASNFHTENADVPQLAKFKQGYFFEWRLADFHKTEIVWKDADYFVDCQEEKNPKMMTSRLFFECLDQLCKGPFRTVPYFDPGVWGGQWMKKKFDLPEAPNYAWSFDGVPEENSILFCLNRETVFEFPAMDLVKYRPIELLGQRVYDRFGAEFPIRFDFLDTMGGQNLSLQVHPTTDYIRENFGMTYTQDESYYFLDVDERQETFAYLGLKKGVDRQKIIEDLKRAQRGEIEFPADQYVNKIPVKKHDHLSIPAGTVHCSGKNTMVLEISATPYIFTFKLWDWGRLGMDGLPRPIHIEHGEKVIAWERDSQWVQENLVSPFQTIWEDEEASAIRTGLYQSEFIDTIRYQTRKKLEIKSDGGVNMLNLTSGKAAWIESPSQKFAPFLVRYAETFLIPAAAGDYTVTPFDCEEIFLIRAGIRQPDNCILSSDKS